MRPSAPSARAPTPLAALALSARAVALTEAITPLALLGLMVAGWHRRRVPVYLLGSVPIVVFASIWWLHASRMHCSPLGDWWGVPVLLYLELTMLVVCLRA